MGIRRSVLFVFILFLSMMNVVACGDEEKPISQEAPRVITLSTDVSALATPGSAISILPTPLASFFPENVADIKPAPGKAVVMGQIISSITGQPVAYTPVRMAEIFYAEGANRDPNQAAWALDNAQSPFAYSNENGFFVFQDVEPVDFVIFVGDILDRYNVETNEKELPIRHEAPADVVTDLGPIQVEY